MEIILYGRNRTAIEHVENLLSRLETELSMDLERSTMLDPAGETLLSDMLDQNDPAIVIYIGSISDSQMQFVKSANIRCIRIPSSEELLSSGKIGEIEIINGFKTSSKNDLKLLLDKAS